MHNPYLHGLVRWVGAAWEGVYGIDIQQGRQKKEQICLLPGCSTPATHRGGYCCAEHCRQHQLKKYDK